MGEPAEKKRWPWILLGMVLLALLAATTHRLLAGEEDIPAASLVYVALTSVTAFWVGRILLNIFWGLVLAVLFAVHPLVLQASVQSPAFLQAEFLKLAVFVCVLLIWKLTLRRERAFFTIMGLGLLNAVFGGWAWLTSPQAGWTTLLFSAVCFGMLAVLAGWRRRHQDEKRIPLLHVVLVAMLAMTIPVLSLAAAFGVSQGAAELNKKNVESLQPVFTHPLAVEDGVTALLQNSFQPQSGTNFFPGTSLDALQEWAWPYPWATLAVLLLGLYRTIRRGWIQWPTRKAPLSWALLLFVLSNVIADILHSTSVREANFLPLASVAVLLGVFGIADWLRSIGDQIVLKPPGEE